MARLVLGDIDLMGSPESPYAIYALGTDSGTTWGNPAPIEVELRSFLQDGAVVVTQGYGNRELSVAVEVQASDGYTLADAEARLFAELGRRNELVYEPHNGPPTVFTVVTSSLDHAPDDLREQVDSKRYYTLRLVCAPWALSAHETITPATGSGTTPPTPPAPTVVTVDACTTTTGWARGGWATTGPTSNGTIVFVRRVGGGGTAGTYHEVTATRTGLSANMSTTPYLRLETDAAAWDGGSVSTMQFRINGTTMTPVFVQPGMYYFDCTGMTVTKVEIAGIFRSGRPATATETVNVRDISRTDQLPTIGTASQLARSLTVGGAARTQGALQVMHETDALGTVVVYTRPDDQSGYVPSSRQFLTSSGTTTADASTASGSRNNPTTAMVYDIPVTALPNGTYTIYARVRSSTTDEQTFTWSAQTRVGSTNVGPSVSGSIAVDYTGGSVWQVVRIGQFRAPVLDMPSAGSTAKVRVTIQQTTSAGGAVAALDEMWLFDVEHGALTIVECGTGTPSSGGPANRLWLNTPTVETPRPTILMGHDADGADARYPGMAAVQAFGVHDFAPGQMLVFTVTAPFNAAVSLAHREAWFTHAAA